jgi:DNA-binding NarL/FixJ family response regulator
VSGPVRVLLADDHALLRRGVRLTLEDSPGLKVVAEAANGAEAVTLARAEDVDLAILDVAMPRMTGLQAAREISRRDPHPKILMLSMYENEQYFYEAIAAGASGYVLKSVVDHDLVTACYAAMRGESFIYPGVLGKLVRDYLDRAVRGDIVPAGVLTARENEVVKLIAEAQSTKEIADILTISPKTVERHRANILQKLGMNDRTEITRYAIRNGLIEP